jgi:hypothetical protein
MVLALTSPDGPAGARIKLTTPNGGEQAAVLTDVAITGPTGPAGPAGPTGPTGPAGGASPALYSFSDDFDLGGTTDPAAIATAGGNFPTGVGNWCLQAVTAAGLVNIQTATSADHPGAINIQASSTINSIVCMRKGIANTAGGAFIFATKLESVLGIVRLDNLTTIRVQVGLSVTVNSPTPANAAQFVYDSSIGANWLCVCRSGGVQTLVDSGIPVVATQWYKLEVKQAVVGTFTFEIDGVERSGGGISTNTPSTSVNLGAFVQTLAASVRSMFIDYFSATSKALSR